MAGQLWIAYDPADATGARPAGGYPPDSVFWTSPDLEIVNGDDAGTAIVDPTGALDQRVRVHVHNALASPVANVKVQAWVWGFSTATGANVASFVSDPAHPERGKTRLVCNVAAVDVNPCALPAGPSQGYFDFNWAPQAADFVGVVAGRAHLCLMASCWAGPDIAPTEGAGLRAAPPSGPDIRADAHFAQRNIALIEAGPHLHFVMAADNPDAEQGHDFTLRVREAGAEALRRLGTRHLLSNRRIRRDAKGHLWFHHGDQRVPVVAAKERARKLEIGAGDKPGHEIRLTLDPRESRALTLEADLRGAEGLHLFELRQYAGKRVVGGAHVLVLALPKSLVPDKRERD